MFVLADIRHLIQGNSWGLACSASFARNVGGHRWHIYLTLLALEN